MAFTPISLLATVRTKICDSGTEWVCADTTDNSSASQWHSSSVVHMLHPWKRGEIITRVIRVNFPHWKLLLLSGKDRDFPGNLGGRQKQSIAPHRLRSLWRSQINTFYPLGTTKLITRTFTCCSINFNPLKTCQMNFFYTIMWTEIMNCFII